MPISRSTLSPVHLAHSETQLGPDALARRIRSRYAEDTKCRRFQPDEERESMKLTIQPGDGEELSLRRPNPTRRTSAR